MLFRSEVSAPERRPESNESSHADKGRTGEDAGVESLMVSVSVLSVSMSSPRTSRKRLASFGVEAATRLRT